MLKIHNKMAVKDSKNKYVNLNGIPRFPPIHTMIHTSQHHLRGVTPWNKTTGCGWLLISFG